ncbi:MAG: hypothetical protein Q4E64_02760 [Phascolarctobacterium sp.]|uniref:hypothetical protein n=1 Tax=Phascolarctobacterium sp. TaxID=2049039 RepID=UPI0026DBD587|nr:hypothetical protein [Phascolarctobacterium sp.]MDO4920735.1 hypothetical protein [Phascolarctobacterium sp.]
MLVYEADSYAKGVRGENIIQLPEGEYLAEELKQFDKILLPRGFYAAFVAHQEDKNKVRVFENEACVIDSHLDEYNKILIFNLGKRGIHIDLGIKEELSDEDLLAVAGGKRKESCRIFVTDCPSLCAEHKGPLDDSYRFCIEHLVTR